MPDSPLSRPMKGVRWPSARLGLRLVLLAAIVAAAVVVIWRGERVEVEIEAGLRQLGVWTPLAFIAAYALCAPLGMPGVALTLLGGVLFGPVWGSLWSLLGATVGGSLAFLVARYLAADWARRRLGGRLERLVEGIEAEGWKFVCFVRLVPLFPYNVLNFALGLTRIKLTHFAVASFFAMAPGAIAYTYLGHAGRAVASGDERSIQIGLIGLGVLAARAFLPFALRRWRRTRGTSPIAPSKGSGPSKGLGPS